MTTNPTPAMSDEVTHDMAEDAVKCMVANVPENGWRREVLFDYITQQRAKDNAEGWHGHKFKEIRRGHWECECGTVLNEALITESEAMTAEQQLAASPPISAQVGVDERAEFEKWYEGTFGQSLGYLPDKNHKAGCWIAWQARAALGQSND